MDKYIKVSDFNDCCDTTKIVPCDELLQKAQETISVDDIKKLIIKYRAGKDSVSGNLWYELNSLINLQSEKYGGLTIEDWKQLRKHPFIKVRHLADCSNVFLSDIINDDLKLIQLVADADNMTRTDLDLPDGIRIDITFIDRGSSISTTPLSRPLSAHNIKHYRIIGVENE